MSPDPNQAATEFYLEAVTQAIRDAVDAGVPMSRIFTATLDELKPTFSLVHPLAIDNPPS